MSRQLCIMACAFTRNPNFQRWVKVGGYSPRPAADGQALSPEDKAKAFILEVCLINSRNELDTSPAAAALFHEFIRKPFLVWMNTK